MKKDARKKKQQFLLTYKEYMKVDLLKHINIKLSLQETTGLVTSQSYKEWGMTKCI